MGNSNPKAVMHGECIAALMSSEGVAKGGLTAKEITESINVVRKGQGVSLANIKAVRDHLRSMAVSPKPRIRMENERRPYFYSLFTSPNEKGERKLTDPVQNNKGNGDSKDLLSAPPNQKVLRALREEAYNVQGSRGFPHEKRKSRESLKRMSLGELQAWIAQVPAIREASIKENDELSQAKVAVEVARALESQIPKLPIGGNSSPPYVQGMENLDARIASKREEELENEYQKSLITAQACLEAERKASNDLRKRLVQLEQEKVRSPQRPADAPPRGNTALKGDLLKGVFGRILAMVIVGILVCCILFLVTWVYTEVKSGKVPVESVSSQPKEKETAAQLSRRRSTPTQDELDNHPAVQRTRALIERNLKLLE